MNKLNKPTQKDLSEFVKDIEAKAAAQNKTVMVHLSEQSDGLRKMFIRWLTKDIEQLENIKSERE